MSTETNKALLRRFVEELMNQGNMAVAPELVAPDFIELDPFPGQTPGRAGLIESIERLRTAFPDLVWRIEEMVAEGEKVASLHTWSGTHQGEFLGIAPTGKRVRMSCTIFDTYQDGKLKQSHLVMNVQNLLQQLDIMPETEQEKSP
ncbi:MAG TPA: ester cyclase [Ktedonobacteraceae bacterium]